MKKIRIFTDPHLGVSRQAHTTRESSARLKQELYDQAMSVVHCAELDGLPVLNCGDLFDKAQNKEDVIVQGYNVASKTRWTVSGNHDELNREGVVTSLAALQDMGVNVIAAPSLSAAYFYAEEAIYIVPHHASHELFEEALLLAANHAAFNREGKASFLFLHCNYQFALATEDNTLNLTAEMTDTLLHQFDIIFLGHEHVPAKHKDGRVVILGNTMPTSFSDISDKFEYDLDLETAELTQKLIWEKASQYREIQLGSEIGDLEGVQFIDVVGAESVANATQISDFINDIWKASHFKPEGEDNHFSDLLAVRNKVIVTDSLDGMATDVDPVALDDLETRIRADLSGTDLEPLFNQLMNEAKQ